MSNKNDLIERAQRVLGGMAVVTLVCLIGTAALWKVFFKYVDNDEMLIIIAKSGEPLGPDQILADEGQKGIQKRVYGEGRHFVMPIVYDYKIESVVVIEPGQIGVVESKVGDTPPRGSVLVDDGQKGIWRRVLPPGKYRMNPYGYKIETHPAVTIRPGYVGFLKRKVGTQPAGEFADPAKDEQGIVKNTLPPGTYYLNPHEYEWREVEIGINQISFLGAEALARDTRSSGGAGGGARDASQKGQIEFPSADAFPISLDATIEWELLPEFVAPVMTQFGDRAAIEDKVIVPQSKSIGRTEGSKYGAKELLLGEGREKFQRTFQGELVQICTEKGIEINSAFIRHISIPDELMKPIRDKKVADEKKVTAVRWKKTRQAAAELEREETMIDQRRQEVRSELQAKVLEVEADADKAIRGIDAETKVQVAAIEKQIAEIESDTKRVLGQAEADVVKMRGEAEGKAFAAKVLGFKGNAEAYYRYVFASNLHDDFHVRVLETGPGTLWTDVAKTAGFEGLGAADRLRDAQDDDGGRSGSRRGARSRTPTSR